MSRFFEMIFVHGNQGVESLINIEGENINLNKNLIMKVNSYVACLGRVGVGKSSLCSYYYKLNYGVDKNYFEISSDVKSRTKGLWVLSEKERMKIQENISKDIIDVEGFQIDEIQSWKYIMIISFLATDIILLNKEDRYDDIKKIFKIIVKSLEKMQKAGIPRMLKTICIQITSEKDDEDEEDEFTETFNKIIDYLEINDELKKEVFKGIEIKPIFIPALDKSARRKVKEDLLKNPKYKEALIESFKQLTPNNISNCVASLERHVDNFNLALNGENGFNMEKIYQDLVNDFEAAYLREKNKKINELLKDTKLLELNDENESFDDWINRHTINFKFDVNLEELTFYGSSESFDNYYGKLKENKKLEIDPAEVFLDIYKMKKKQLECKNEEEKYEIYQKFWEKRIKIDKYFNQLKFYDDIKTDFDFEIKVKPENKQTEYLKNQIRDLKEYYSEKTENIKKKWEDLIQENKWKSVVQARGRMECENGHNLNENVVCSKCNGTLYWADSSNGYVMCQKCPNNGIKKMSKDLLCTKCDGKSYCEVKWLGAYRP